MLLVSENNRSYFMESRDVVSIHLLQKPAVRWVTPSTSGNMQLPVVQSFNRDFAPVVSQDQFCLHICEYIGCVEVVKKLTVRALIVVSTISGCGKQA